MFNVRVFFLIMLNGGGWAVFRGDFEGYFGAFLDGYNGDFGWFSGRFWWAVRGGGAVGVVLMVVYFLL